VRIRVSCVLQTQSNDMGSFLVRMVGMVRTIFNNGVKTLN